MILPTIIQVPNQKFCYHFGSFIPYSDCFSLNLSQLDQMILKALEIKPEPQNLRVKQCSDNARGHIEKLFFLWQTLTRMVTLFFDSIWSGQVIILRERSQNPGNLKNWCGFCWFFGLGFFFFFFFFFHYLQTCRLNNLLLFLKTSSQTSPT